MPGGTAGNALATCATVGAAAGAVQDSPAAANANSSAAAARWRQRAESFAMRLGSGHPVLFEEGEHAGPGVLCVLGAIARPIVGVEAVRRVGVDLELAVLAGRLAGRLPLVDRLLRNALVLPAVKG